MNDLAIKVIDYIFSEGGPLHRRMGGEFRATQAALAQHRARFISKPLGEKRNIAMVQADTGVGKTLAVLIPAAVFAKIDPASPRKTVIATGTISLREQMLGDRSLVNDMVAEGFAHFDLPVPTEIKIETRPSFTAYISVDKAMALKPHLSDDGAANDTAAAHALDFISYVEETVESNEDPTFDGWFSDERSFGRLPTISRAGLTVMLTEQDLSLDPKTMKRAKDIIQSFGEQIARAADADIMLVTHSMMVWNNLTWGRTLNTCAASVDESGVETPASDFKDLMIDEADNLLSLAMNSTDSMISLDDLETFIYSLNADHPSFDEAETCFRYISDIITRGYPQKARKKAKTVREIALDAGSWDECSRTFIKLVDCLETILASEDAVANLQYESLCRPLREMKKIFGMAGTNHSDILPHEWSGSDIFAEAFYADSKIVRIGTKPTSGRNLVNRTWLWNGVNSFETVGLMSATLASANGDMKEFSARIGVPKSFGAEFAEFKADRDFGHISDIFYADSDIPSPMLSAATAKKMIEGENESGVSFDNPKYFEYLAKTVLLAQKRGGRTLLLLSSSNALLEIERLLISYGVSPSDLFVQKKGMKTKGLMRSFAGHENGIWLGLKWAGENFVDDQNRSLLHGGRVMVAKIPFSVPNMVHDHAKFEYMNVVEDGIRLFKQGIGRGIRDFNADIELWICDPRFPKPKSILGWLQYPSGYRNEYFKSVADRVIDDRFTTGVRAARSHLIQMDENGEVTTASPQTRRNFGELKRMKRKAA